MKERFTNMMKASMEQVIDCATAAYTSYLKVCIVLSYNSLFEAAFIVKAYCNQYFEI